MLSAEQILAEALKLDRSDRAQLLDALLASLEGEDLGPEWEQAIARRVAEFDAGLVVMAPASAVFQKLAHRFGAK